MYTHWVRTGMYWYVRSLEVEASSVMLHGVASSSSFRLTSTYLGQLCSRRFSWLPSSSRKRAYVCSFASNRVERTVIHLLILGFLDQISFGSRILDFSERDKRL